jgi:branched-chain amino acid transport system substrate-binding protein
MGDVDFTEFDGFNNQNKHQMLVQQILDAQYETVFPQQFATKKPTYPFPGWK